MLFYPMAILVQRGISGKFACVLIFCTLVIPVCALGMPAWVGRGIYATAPGAEGGATGQMHIVMLVIQVLADVTFWLPNYKYYVFIVVIKKKLFWSIMWNTQVMSSYVYHESTLMNLIIKSYQSYQVLFRKLFQYRGEGNNIWTLESHPSMFLHSDMVVMWSIRLYLYKINHIQHSTEEIQIWLKLRYFFIAIEKV